MKTIRDFTGHSFFRKLGPACLLQYLQTTQHPQQSQFLAELLEEEHISNPEEILRHFDSPNNPNRTADMTAFMVINDIASEKGFAHMRRICERSALGQLLTPTATPHSLALELFLNHSFVFNRAYTMFCIDYLEGWKVYPGSSGKSEFKEDINTARDDFRREVLAYLKRIGFGSALNVDAYPEADRLILDLRYAGPLTRQEDFDEQGNIQTHTIRRPLDIGLAYYPSEAVLKVKTPRGMDGLNIAVYQAFANSYLKDPNILLNINTERLINLSEFKTRQEFLFNESDGIRNAKITGVKLIPYEGSPSSITLYDKTGALEAIKTRNVDLDQSILKMIGIQFEFDEKGLGRFRTVELTHKNRINTNNSQRDAIMEGCLKRWGILYG